MYNLTHKPFISVIIPTLNEELYLPKLLQSLTKQSAHNFEVIVVDGHSDDTTQQVVRTFTAPYSLRVLNTSFRNIARQRNIGAKHAKGTYLLFLDADTNIKPKFMAELTTSLNHKQPDFASTSISFTSHHVFDALWGGFNNTLKPLLNKCGWPFIAGYNLIFKKSAFKYLGGFDPTIVHSEDFECVQRAARAKLKSLIFLTLTVYLSPRRFNREGRLTVMLKYWQALVYNLLYGPIKKELFRYDMGGHVK